MTLPKTYHLLVPFSKKDEPKAKNEDSAWIHSFTSQPQKASEGSTLNYKLYHQKNMGTLSVSFKPNDTEQPLEIVKAPSKKGLENTKNIFSKARALDEADRFTNRPDDATASQWFVAQKLTKYAIDNELNQSDFDNKDWLNTPGPLYTTNKNTYGSGYIIAQHNIAFNSAMNQVIFKQPLNKKESDKTILALELDDFEGYYFDGNCCWNKDNILAWWDKSEDRVAAILELYKQELYKTAKEDKEDFKRPTPENYKYWLDFYQGGMKHYLEWYLEQLSGEKISLPELQLDWSIKEKLDKIFFLKFLSKIKE